MAKTWSGSTIRLMKPGSYTFRNIRFKYNTPKGIDNKDIADALRGYNFFEVLDFYVKSEEDEVKEDILDLISVEPKNEVGEVNLEEAKKLDNFMEKLEEKPEEKPTKNVISTETLKKIDKPKGNKTMKKLKKKILPKDGE